MDDDRFEAAREDDRVGGLRSMTGFGWVVLAFCCEVADDSFR